MATTGPDQFADAVDDGEGLLRQPNTVAFTQDRELGRGVLSIEKSFLSWLSDDKQEQLCLDYPDIAIHAISRDTSSFPHQCIFILHCPPVEDEEWGEEGEREEEGEEEREGEGEEGAEETSSTTEIRLVPPDPSQLEGIYEAICECQKLYPDPEQSNSEEEEEGEGEGGEGDITFDPSGGEFFTGPEGLRHLSAEGEAVLAHLESILQLPSPEQFAEMVTNGDSIEDQDQFEDAD